MIGCVPPTRSISFSWISATACAVVRSGISDLVEKQRPVVGQFELSKLLPDRFPGEGAPFSWPNSVLSTSSRGIAARLTATNGALGCADSPVNQTRQQLLAGAALTEDQDHRRQLRDFLHELEDLLGGPARAGGDELAIVLLGDLRAQPQDVTVGSRSLAFAASVRTLSRSKSLEM